MAKCYQCRYFCVGERKCAFSGYSKSPDDDCSRIYDFESNLKRCCGNCKYYRPQEKRCVNNGSTYEIHHECGIGEYSPA
ncbi:MAG: hypothetical protein IJY27_02990 [Clostridia bacterium]|nr:hypothetical protein [Clostridia bacterium]